MPYIYTVTDQNKLKDTAYTALTSLHKKENTGVSIHTLNRQRFPFSCPTGLIIHKIRLEKMKYQKAIQ